MSFAIPYEMAVANAVRNAKATGVVYYINPTFGGSLSGYASEKTPTTNVTMVVDASGERPDLVNAAIKQAEELLKS